MNIIFTIDKPYQVNQLFTIEEARDQLRLYLSGRSFNENTCVYIWTDGEKFAWAGYKGDTMYKRTKYFSDIHLTFEEFKLLKDLGWKKNCI